MKEFNVWKEDGTRGSGVVESFYPEWAARIWVTRYDSDYDYIFASNEGSVVCVAEVGSDEVVKVRVHGEQSITYYGRKVE